MFSFEKIEHHQSETLFEQNFDENFQKLNLTNLYYPGPVVPLIGYEEDIWKRLPNLIGDDGSNLEVSTLDNKTGIVVEIVDKG